MTTVVIIGAGNIGSRHLQSICRLEIKMSVFVIDPSLKSLNIAKKRLYEVKKRNNKSKYIFSKNQKELPKNIDLAIISTNSDVRKKVINNLIKNSNVNFFILEKFTFQSNKCFKEIISSFQSKNIKSWVNCPFRVFKSYKNLKNKINNKNFKMKVHGGNWGMASNMLHYIDLFCFLANSINFKIKNNYLEKKIFKSKRKYFDEIKGILKITHNKNELIVEDNNSKKEVTVSINTYNYNYKIFELKNKVIIKNNKNNQLREKKFILPRQSEFGNSIIKKILQNKKSELIKLENSYKLQKKIISFLNLHFSKIYKKKINKCPIS